MPKIRDAVFAQEALTTDGGLTIPMCDYALNDLLFAFLIGDTGSPTLTCSNGIGTWTQLFQQTNTCMFACYWKYAAASGEGDVVFTATVSETYCGFLVSVRDVYQSYSGGSPPVKNNTTQASATIFQMPTITTSADNSLVLMAVANSSANGSTVFVNGIGLTQTIINGTAEGGALGWFVQQATGTTPSTIDCSNVTGGAGVKAVIEVRAPAGGATVMPAYPAADDGLLLALNPGIAYDGSTALAATADTAFGTSIGGVTANDATVATGVTDVGVDDKGFINAAGITNAASATAISGSEVIVPSGKYNIGDANILCHLRSVTTIASQNIGALGTTRGAWFGMRSGATNGTNYKIWQVHGIDAPYYGVAVVPIIINPANTDTRATAGTLSNSDVRQYGFWTSGSGALTGQTIIGPLWKMGTTTIAGGTSTEPISVPGIAFAAGKGKCRWSAVQQGASQLLCLQAVQFGNGGTNPIYLDLDSTAIEFPSKRDLTKKLVNYNGPDNQIGFTYYAGASDTIKHRASVVSSSSKYHWRIHASSSSSATYDFNGLSIIGAGDVQLRDVTTFTGMSFTTCPTITTNGADLTECTFLNSTVLVSSPANAANITDSSFTKTTGTSHGIEITGTAADMTLTGVTFTGYAGTNGSSGNEAIYVNIASGSMTISIAGGGSTPSIRTAGATVTVQNAVTVTVTAKDADTAAAVQSARALLYASTGTTVTITRSGSTATVTHTGHGKSTNDKVVISGAAQGEYNGIKTITVSDANTYTYTVSGTPATPATGTITSYRVILDGDTNASGILQTTAFNYTADLAVTGRVRKGTSSTFYKTSPLSGTITANGLDVTAFLVKDT